MGGSEGQLGEPPFVPGLRKRLQKRAQACGRCSRGRVWGTVKSRLPILDWLFKYSPRQAFLGDLIAGLTVGVMSLPQGECRALQCFMYKKITRGRNIIRWWLLLWSVVRRGIHIIYVV